MAKNLRFLTALKSPYLRPNLPISKHKSPYLGQRRYHMYVLHCHSFKSHFKFFTFILSHASLRIILSNEGDAVSIDRSIDRYISKHDHTCKMHIYLLKTYLFTKHLMLDLIGFKGRDDKRRYQHHHRAESQCCI